jgi:serine/threonine-protein kinase
MAHEQQRYRVIDRLAAGGMAEVYLAESAGIEGFKKTVAIKRVLPHLSEKKRFIAMFLDEARLSANLSHSNVVQVFDIGVGDKTYFIVMEYVDGADLKLVINHLRDQNKTFPVEQAVYICTKMCEGLAYAHESNNEKGELLNVVHRDISPPNVLISKHGEVKIVDFGLAKASTQLEKSEAGIIKGKFSYLAPEAAHGEEVDARADIFAVGIILWEMLAGRRLFQGKTDYETVKLVQGAEVPPLRQFTRDADDRLQRIIDRTLARERERRYASARSLGRDLARYLYSLGKPVCAFDIAELVRGPMMLRHHKKQASEGTSIIDKLIQETLFQFTSLQDQDQGGPSSSEVAIIPFSFEDFAGYADRQKKAAAERLDIPDLGNLASLEEDPRARALALEDSGEFRETLADLEDPSGSAHPLPSAPPSSRRSSIPGARSSFPSAPMSVPPSSQQPSQRAPQSAGHPASGPHLQAPPSSSLAIKAVLVVVIAVGTMAVVWFSGLL